MMLRLAPALLVIASAASGQTFEVASVKPSAPRGSGPMTMGLQGGPGTPDPTRVRFSNMALAGLVSFAYGMSGFQISGPSWTSEDHFDIVATLVDGSTKEQFRTMLQNLLVERFGLETHREQRVIPLYSLTAAKGGAKLAMAKSDPGAETESMVKPVGGMQKDKDGYPKFPPGVTRMGMMSEGAKTRASLQAHDQPVGWLLNMLSGQMGAPVTDDTGLTGKYDYAMTWMAEAPGSVSPDDLGGPSLLNALQEQLGLKLTAKKGPIEFIVIDRAQRTPVEN